MNNNKKKILAFGAVYLQFEKYGFPPLETIKPDAEIVGQDYDVVPAGSAVTFARVCSALGLEAVFIGKTGDDRPAEIVEDLLRKEKIIPHLVKDPTKKTNLVDINNTWDGKVFQDVVGTANQSLTPPDVTLLFNQYLSRVDFLYLGGCFKMKAFLDHYHEYIKKAHSNGVKVVLNHGRVTNKVTASEIELMRNLIDTVDYYIAGKDEFLTITGAHSLEGAFAKISGRKNLTVVTDGTNGAYSLERGSAVHVPAFKVKVLNSVTAGDSFNAGFIKAVSESVPLKESLRFACATAALKISGKGLPDPDGIKKLLD